MFCDFNYWQDEGALEGTKKDGETIFQRIRQRQGCEEKQPICLYTVGRRRSYFIVPKNRSETSPSWANTINLKEQCLLQDFYWVLIVPNISRCMTLS